MRLTKEGRPTLGMSSSIPGNVWFQTEWKWERELRITIHLSSSWLRMQCDQPPHALAGMPSLLLGRNIVSNCETNKLFLPKMLLSCFITTMRQVTNTYLIRTASCFLSHTFPLGCPRRHFYYHIHFIKGKAENWKVKDLTQIIIRGTNVTLHHDLSVCLCSV